VAQPAEELAHQPLEAVALVGIAIFTGDSNPQSRAA